MNREALDVSVIWKRPLWPFTVLVVIIEIILIPLALNPRYGLAAQIVAPTLLFSWITAALIFSARRRRRHASKGRIPPI
jgi:hypothetical protein